MEERTTRCSQPSADGSRNVRAVNNDSPGSSNNNNNNDDQEETAKSNGSLASVPIAGRLMLLMFDSALTLRLHERHASA